MHIDQLLLPMAEKAEQYETTLPLSWGQGRTLFGGVSAALLYQAMANEIEDERPVRSLSINFIAPLKPDTPLTIRARILRQGRSVSQVSGEVYQGDQVAVAALASFGHARDSKLQQPNRDSHDMRLPRKPKYIPQIPKVTPKFLQHFELAVDRGSLVYAGNKDATLHGWCRFKEPPEHVSNAHLVALLDCWPPTMLQMLRLPFTASTMSWNIEFIQPARLRPDEWLACICEAYHIQDGYGHEEAKFWNTRGELLAIARQVVTVFA